MSAVNTHGTASSAFAMLYNERMKHYIFSESSIIGRSRTANICIIDGQISRKHCVIEKSKDNKFTICDMSNCGTFLNENRLVQNIPQELRHKDRINLAGVDEYTYVFIINLKQLGIKDTCKKKPRSPLTEKMIDLNETQNMEKETMDNKLSLVQAEMSRLKEELEQKLKSREDELERERLKASKESIYHKELADKAEMKLKEMLEEKEKTLEELQKNKNEMEGRHQIERDDLENRCKAEIEDLKKKLENSETKHQQFEELQARLEETKGILLESELEQQRLFEAKVEVETKLESKIIDLTCERENKEEQVNELKKKLKEKEELEEKVRKDIEGLEEDMMCSICAEIYIEPTALNCGHMFCKMCIHEWNKKKKICPMCRAKISTTIRIFNMDSVIERNIRLMPEEARTHRETLITERKRGKTPKKRTAKKRRREHQQEAVIPEVPDPVQLPLAHRNNVWRPFMYMRPDPEVLLPLQISTEAQDPFQDGWVNNETLFNHTRIGGRDSPVTVAAVDLTNSVVDDPRRSNTYGRTHTVTSADANTTIDLTSL